MNRHRHLTVATLLLAVIAGVTPLAIHWGNRWMNRHLLECAQTASAEGDYEAAEGYAARLLARTSSRQASILAGEAAMLQGHTDQAIEYFEPLLGETDADAIAAICAVGDLHLRNGHATAAERLFRRALELDPNQVFAKRELVYLLTLQGRRRDSLPLRFELVKSGEFTSDDLRLLGNPRALADNAEIAVFEQAEPDNPMWWAARAQLAFRNSESSKATRLFREVVAREPEFPDGQAGLGLALLDTGTPFEFWTWHNRLPATAESHPDTWVVRGLWAQRHDQPQAAVRCFWEALRREPTHRLASSQLSVALVAVGKPEESKFFADQALKLQVLVELVDRLFGKKRDDVRTMQKAADQSELLGRLWEALGWHRVVLLRFPRNPDSLLAMARLEKAIAPDTPRVVSYGDASSKTDLSDYPLPTIERPAETSTPSPSTGGNTAIHFADVAAPAGLNFSYFAGDDPTTLGRRMFEFTGGGVAVLDYDLDGWPDIYFTQGCHWPRREGQPILRDVLFRNLGDGRFRDVTEEAGLGDEWFGQGVTAGDFNDDGLPDLSVGNVGPNRLYRNNGDGTFAEVAQAQDVRRDHWTTSTLIADLDGDGIADLFDVNYLAGDSAELMCERTCSPAQFDAQADRFLHGQGDGSFVDRTLEAGFDGSDGKGLAIAAFDFNQTGRLAVFVSNDTTANFFYINDQPRGQSPRFTESAMVRGLAFDREGQAQACMGIGVNDANGDGLLDIFVANFYREFNVLYEQMPGGFFADVSRERGLAEPSYQLLTFGVEFVDLDLDGFQDIVATNGHVDDFRDQGIPFHMPPKVYHNNQGNFSELGETCGPFFQQGHLGRSIAVLDWNRDGKEDWVISHLDSPAALLENRTDPVGHHLVLTFTGTETQRDAIGTTCWVTVGDRTMMQQLVGGGGYHTCNQKHLLFGLGPAATADQIEVLWPSGQRQSLTNVPANHTYRLIEGRNQLHRLPIE